MKKKIVFKYQPPIASELAVFLIGDFNNWDKTSHKLEDKNGIYETTLELAPGEYKYHFLIDDKAALDPTADTILVDGIVYSLARIASNDEYIYLVPFKIKDRYKLDKVSIVADFNEWKPNHNPLYKQDNNFSTALFLSSGLYHYKFLAKDGRWFNEEEIKSGANKAVSDNSSNNSLVTIQSKTYRTINRELIASADTNRLELKQEIVNIYRYSERQFEFKIIIPDLVNIRVKLVLNGNIHELDFVASDGINCSFNKILELENISLIYSYKLIIIFDKYELYANKNTLTNNPEIASIFVPKHYKVFSIDADLSNRIMYQIMPDRFCNGDTLLNPDFRELYYNNARKEPKRNLLTKNQEYYHLSTWSDTDILTKSPYSEKGEADWFVFYGGDLAGVKEKIPYLKELGVSLIYFNPIFTAKSPHRYDTIDFKSIDPHLGSNQYFKELVEALHDQDIKVIIDIALNHCGVDFFAFKDTLLKGDKSQYWTWFDWKKWPLPEKIDKNFNAEEYYQCWWGIKDLPEFNYDFLREPPEEDKVADIQQASPNVELVNYLLESMKYWVEEMNIDGFRLDVPEEVPLWFWKLFQTEMKELNPNIYIVGEIWNTPKSWLQGEYFDAIMNYSSFKDPCITYFFQNEISLLGFKNALSSGLIYTPERVNKCQMNLLASHDTIRIRRLVKDNLDELKLAILFQFTFPGIPHIYYGDEVFLDGNKDPDNRRPFPWDYEKEERRVEVLEFYKLIITIRKSNNLFTEGRVCFVEDQNLLIYERWLASKKQKAVIILNNNNSKIDITSYIKEFPNQLLGKLSNKHILEYGYYIATT